MYFKGIIHSIDLNKKIISIKTKSSIKCFYFQTKLFKRFKKFLYEGILISFESVEYFKIKNNTEAYLILDVYEIININQYKTKVLFNKEKIDDALLEFLKSLKTKIFIDTEMTLVSDNSEESELIQAGLILTDKDNQTIEELNYYIRPTKARFINSRTKEFLHIKQSLIQKEGVSYYKFYNKFKTWLNKYRPAVIIFGKNDKLFLEKSYNTNGLPSLTFMTRFINILELIKTYYNLNNDPGLFHLYEIYYSKEDLYQEHNALEDAYVTKKVFEAFLKDMEQGGVMLPKIKELDIWGEKYDSWIL